MLDTRWLGDDLVKVHDSRDDRCGRHVDATLVLLVLLSKDRTVEFEHRHRSLKLGSTI